MKKKFVHVASFLKWDFLGLGRWPGTMDGFQRETDRELGRNVLTARHLGTSFTVKHGGRWHLRGGHCQECAGKCGGCFRRCWRNYWRIRQWRRSSKKGTNSGLLVSFWQRGDHLDFKGGSSALFAFAQCLPAFWFWSTQS